MQMAVLPAPSAGASSASTPTAGDSAAGESNARVPTSEVNAQAADTPIEEAMPTPGGDMGAEAAAGAAGMAGQQAPADTTRPTPSATGSELPPVTDYTASGPFSATMEANTGPGGGYAIFRPDILGENGFLHPLIIFGPGILTSPTSYTTLLDHLATHGYVTIVVNALSAGPGSAANVEAMQLGLDWLIEQNGPAGVFQGKLDVERAVTMGYSLGATASVQLSSHAAIVTTVSIHGHSTSGDPHGPVLLLTGTMDVIDDVRQTFSTLEQAPAMLAALPIGHLAVLGELGASGRYLAPITAWLRYWVNGDDAAKQAFWGADCGMCASPWIAPETNALWEAQAL